MPIGRKPLKLNTEHFKEKKIMVDEIDVDSIQKPIRASTPTPSVTASTVLARHLDFSLDDIDTTLEKKEEVSTDSDDRELNKILELYLKNVKRHEVQHKNIKKEVQKDSDIIPNKNQYCKEWMKQEEGVSTNNCDALLPVCSQCGLFRQFA